MGAKIVLLRLEDVLLGWSPLYTFLRSVDCRRVIWSSTDLWITPMELVVAFRQQNKLSCVTVIRQTLDDVPFPSRPYDYVFEDEPDSPWIALKESTPLSRFHNRYSNLFRVLANLQWGHRCLQAYPGLVGGLWTMTKAKVKSVQSASSSPLTSSLCECAHSLRSHSEFRVSTHRADVFKLYLPNAPNRAGFNSFILHDTSLFMFQMTIATEHTIKTQYHEDPFA